MIALCAIWQSLIRSIHRRCFMSRTFYIIGAGMGAPDSLTGEAFGIRN